jgi:hypothetical protein
MSLLKPALTATAAGGALLASDDAEGLIIHPGIKGAREFAGHRRGDRKAPRIGKDPNGNMIGIQDMQKRIEELKLALSKMDNVEDQSRLINAFVHSSTDYSSAKIDGKWPKDSWSNAVGKADGGVNGPAYITGMDILAENLVEKLGEEFTPAIQDYVKRRIGDAGKGRDASYGGEAGKFIAGKNNLSGTFDPMDRAAYEASVSRLPSGSASLSVGAPTLGQDHLEATMHNREQKLNEHMDNLGLTKDSMYEYGSLLPIKTNVVTGNRSLAAPDIVRDVMRGLLGLGMTPETGVYDPDDLLNTVL